MKKVIAIVGTYRKEGIVDSITDEILAAAKEGGAEIEKIYLIDTHIEFCTNCRACTQSPGPERGRCVHKDDMEAIFAKMDSADGIVLASPVNFFNITAVTRRFMERFVSFAYWPWGNAGPKLRTKEKPRKAVLVTATAMPALMGRVFTGALRALKIIADVSGAKTVDKIFVGLASVQPKQPLSACTIKKARRAGLKLIS